MEVFLLCEDIDLGYHVHGAFTSEDDASAVVESRNKAYVEMKVKQYLDLGYTEDQARAEIQNGPFFVETVEVFGSQSKRSETPEELGSRLFREGKGLSSFWGEAPDTSSDTLNRMYNGYCAAHEKAKRDAETHIQAARVNGSPWDSTKS